MKLQILLPLVVLFLIISSCSDDTTVLKPDIPECLLLSYTDSSNYYFEIEYDEGRTKYLYQYNFVDGKKNNLINRVEYNRNLFNEITHINYFDKSGEFQGVDSIYTNNNGLPFDNISFNAAGNMVEKASLVYDNLENVIQKKIYIFEETWNLKTIYSYEYDEQGRVISSVREQLSFNGSQFDSTSYTYDNMKNIDNLIDIFSVFKTNNFLTATTVYTLLSGKTSTETKYYEYEYNELGYPIKTKITSSVDANDVKFKYNTLECSR